MTAPAAPARTAVPTDGLLEIDLAPRADGRTGVAGLVQRFPQRVTAPMYLDTEAPGTAYLCVQNPTGGLFPGDRLRTRVRVRQGAGLQLAGQSATQVHPGADAAEQHYEFVVDDGGVLEHLPHPTIPHRAAVFGQDSTIALHGDAVYLGWEALAAGRIGHRERFAFTSATTRLRLENDGVAVARETLRLVPGRADPSTPGVLADHDYVASMLIVAPHRQEALGGLAARTAELLSDGDSVGAVSPLPDTVGLGVRILADRAPALRHALRTVWSAARAALLGRHRLPERI